MADKGGLVHQCKIGSLAPSRLKEDTTEQIIRCLIDGCYFTEQLTWATCRTHGFTHYHNQIECDKLKLSCKILGLSFSSETVCILVRSKEDTIQPRNKFAPSSCKMISGLDQKYREALTYDSNNGLTNWSRKSTKKTKDTADNVEHRILLNMVPVLIIFLRFVRGEEFEVLYGYQTAPPIKKHSDGEVEKNLSRAGSAEPRPPKTNIVKRPEWWYEDDPNIDSVDLLDLVWEYAVKLYELMCMPDISKYVGRYRKISPGVPLRGSIEEMSADEIHLLGVPIMGAYNLLANKTIPGGAYDYKILVSILFKRTGCVFQSIHTGIDKLFHILFNRPRGYKIQMMPVTRAQLDMRINSFVSFSCE